jgi:hypothetical protein
MILQKNASGVTKNGAECCGNVQVIGPPIQDLRQELTMTCSVFYRQPRRIHRAAQRLIRFSADQRRRAPRLREILCQRRCAGDWQQDVRSSSGISGVAVREQTSRGVEQPVAGSVWRTRRQRRADERHASQDRGEAGRGQRASSLYRWWDHDFQEFLRAGLIQRLIMARVPVLFGEGIPLFSTLLRDVKLRRVAIQAYASALVKSEYHVEV